MLMYIQLNIQIHIQMDMLIRENDSDQLKVRIILRKYLSKIIFKIGFFRFLLRLKMLKIYLNYFTY